jgi:hypothetical protein
VRDVLLVLGGALIGGGVSYLMLEHKMDNKHMQLAQEQVETHKRALDLAADVKEERVRNIFADDEGRPEVEIPGPGATELKDAKEPVRIDPGFFQPKSEEGEGFSPETDNPYHTAVAAMETAPETFVAGEPTQYGMAYIEEEEYQEDDGRLKEQIVILMNEHEPVFLQDGAEIRDWNERVGDSILIDMFRYCPPGQRQVLYVRNLATDVDYEVVRDTP